MPAEAHGIYIYLELSELIRRVSIVKLSMLLLKEYKNCGKNYFLALSGWPGNQRRLQEATGHSQEIF